MLLSVSWADAGDEQLIKVAFVYNFAKFTQWPEDERDTFNFCYAGDDELRDDLGRLGGEKVDRRPIVVRPYPTRPEAALCHVLYIAGSEQWQSAALIDSSRLNLVLTISEIRGFADTGGMIQLYRAKDRLRFKINLATTRKVGLKLSARLLELADLVDEPGVP